VLDQGHTANRNIDMDNNDLLNVRVIENLDAQGYEGVMDAQNIYTEKVSPASSQGWGFKTSGDGAYCYVQDSTGSSAELSTISGGASIYLSQPTLRITNITTDTQIILSSKKLYFGTATNPVPTEPTVNAFLGTDDDGNLTYKDAVAVNETTLPAGLTQSTKGIELVIGTTTYYLPLFTST
jgi:hypothetical protein